MSTTKIESQKRKMQSKCSSFPVYKRPMIGNNPVQPHWALIPVRPSFFHPFMSPGSYQPVMPIRHSGPGPMLWNRGLGLPFNLNKARSGPPPTLEKAPPVKKSPVTTTSNFGANQEDSSPSLSSSDFSFKFDDPQSGDCDDIIDETTNDDHVKDSPPLKHTVVLNQLIKERLKSTGTIARVSECQLCGSFSRGDNARSIAKFMRYHIYTHVPKLFSCAVCVTHKTSTKYRMKRHLRKVHGKDAADRAGSILDSQYEIDEKLVDLAVRCFSDSVIQMAPKQ